MWGDLLWDRRELCEHWSPFQAMDPVRLKRPTVERVRLVERALEP